MQLIRETNIQFLKHRRAWMVVSIVVVVLTLGNLIFGKALNLGIDFAGGTQLTLEFKQQPEIERLRQIVAAAGITDASIQRFGKPGSSEILIKTQTVTGSEEGSRDLVTSALDAALQPEIAGRVDLNREGRLGIAELLLESDPDALSAQDQDIARAHYETVAEKILDQRRETGLISTWDAIKNVEGVSPEVVAVFERSATLGEFAVLGSENVGPQIGSELRRKGVLAVVFSLVGMLIYIWFRFELRFSIGALVAATHDVIVTLGLFSLAGFEFNLTTIAGFLTLVGYSVNDTVVIFDRVRENLHRRRSETLETTINKSLNQTLSRTVLTSGTTLLAVGSILFAGGEVLRGFAFIMTVGVVVGTYSSIYVASPITILWEDWLGREARTRRREARPA